MTLTAFFNHDFSPSSKLAIPVNDTGYAFSEGLFETIRGYRGKPFLLAEHLNRMSRGLELLGIPLPQAFAGIPAIIPRLLDRNNLLTTDSVIRITISPGDQESPEANCILTAAPLDQVEISRRQKGMRAGFAAWRRDSRNPLLTIKSLNYLENRLALRQARARGDDEAIFCNQDGAICEGSFSNLFLIQGRELLTPNLDSGLLAGITRAFIIKNAPTSGLSCRETTIYPGHLEEAEGALLCSSLMECAPLLRLGSRTFSLSRGHEVANLIRQAMSQARES